VVFHSQTTALGEDVKSKKEIAVVVLFLWRRKIEWKGNGLLEFPFSACLRAPGRNMDSGVSKSDNMHWNRFDLAVSQLGTPELQKYIASPLSTTSFMSSNQFISIMSLSNNQDGNHFFLLFSCFRSAIQTFRQILLHFWAFEWISIRWPARLLGDENPIKLSTRRSFLFINSSPWQRRAILAS
jgi:hypothetical protein